MQTTANLPVIGLDLAKTVFQLHIVDIESGEIQRRQIKRVFEIDMEHCPNCDGQLKIIAAILEQPVIEKILTHLGLQSRASPRAPARGQALHAARRRLTLTVQASRRPGPPKSAAPEGLRHRWKRAGDNG